MKDVKHHTVDAAVGGVKNKIAAAGATVKALAPNSYKDSGLSRFVSTYSADSKYNKRMERMRDQQQRRDSLATRETATLQTSTLSDGFDRMVKLQKGSLVALEKIRKAVVMNDGGGLLGGLGSKFLTKMGFKGAGKIAGGAVAGTAAAGLAGAAATGAAASAATKGPGFLARMFGAGAQGAEVPAKLLSKAERKAAIKAAEKAAMVGPLPKVATGLGGLAKAGTGFSTFSKAASTAAIPVAEVAGKSGGLVGKLMGKGALKTVGKSLLKKLPIIGAIAGLGFGLHRLMKGDYTGAALELASGGASLIPGIGTAASVGIDAAIIARDVIKTPEGEEIPKGEVAPTEQSTKKSTSAFGPKEAFAGDTNATKDPNWYKKQQEQDQHDGSDSIEVTVDWQKKQYELNLKQKKITDLQGKNIGEMNKNIDQRLPEKSWWGKFKDWASGGSTPANPGGAKPSETTATDPAAPAPAKSTPSPGSPAPAVTRTPGGAVDLDSDKFTSDGRAKVKRAVPYGVKLAPGVDLSGLQQETYDGLVETGRKFKDDPRNKGKDLQVNSAYRSQGKQDRLRSEHLEKLRKEQVASGQIKEGDAPIDDHTVAKVSDHTGGAALDFDRAQTIAAAKQGNLSDTFGQIEGKIKEKERHHVFTKSVARQGKGKGWGVQENDTRKVSYTEDVAADKARWAEAAENTTGEPSHKLSYRKANEGYIGQGESNSDYVKIKKDVGTSRSEENTGKTKEFERAPSWNNAEQERNTTDSTFRTADSWNKGEFVAGKDINPYDGSGIKGSGGMSGMIASMLGKSAISATPAMTQLGNPLSAIAGETSDQILQKAMAQDTGGARPGETREQYQKRIKTSYAASREEYVKGIESGTRAPSATPGLTADQLTIDPVASVDASTKMREQRRIEEEQEDAAYDAETARRATEQATQVVAEPVKKKSSSFWGGIKSGASDMLGGLHDFAKGTVKGAWQSTKDIATDAQYAYQTAAPQALGGKSEQELEASRLAINTDRAKRNAEADPAMTGRRYASEDLAYRRVENTEQVARTSLAPIEQDLARANKDKTENKAAQSMGAAPIAQPRLSTDSLFLVEDAGLNLVILGVI
jgi:hypothetical protein